MDRPERTKSINILKIKNNLRNNLQACALLFVHCTGTEFRQAAQATDRLPPWTRTHESWPWPHESHDATVPAGGLENKNGIALARSPDCVVSPGDAAHEAVDFLEQRRSG
ncbi:hypothetical protein [Solidesulfovibrio sp.]|uniref:hypothetical protein n=1 Tax=Solidesulfovibrio sp. TaxID=2910990 RepID=UPI0026103E4F|nr:hypothetical protein [Solidesulfovibrio sp.]